MRARSATCPWWVADNGTDKSTLYPVVGTNLGTNPLVGGATGVVCGRTGAISALAQLTPSDQGLP